VRFSDLATLAGGLTLLRVLVAAAIPLLPREWWLPAYLLALGTDVLDGPVARWSGRVTTAGATFDAWADKTLAVNVAWTLVNAGVFPGWWLIFLFSREILQMPMVFALAHRWRTGVGRPHTRIVGRLTTLALAATTTLALVGFPSLALTIAVGVLGVAAATDYARLHFAHLRFETT
jgi:phosphatidylglycerophosphate synthase